jgi:hypothetical protein
VKYALLIYSNEQAWESLTDEERAAVLADYIAISESPAVVGGEQLQSPTTATTVRVTDGRMMTTDGPFVETKEMLGGFYLVEADDLDAALEIAARIPAARRSGAVEVRPVVER